MHLRGKGFPCGSTGKEFTCNVGDLGLIPSLGRSPREGNDPLQYSGLENSTNCIVHGVAKSWTFLSDFHSHFLQQTWASRVLASWGSAKMNLTSGQEPACQCRRCKRHSSDLWAGKIPWKRARQPTLVFLSREFHGQRNLAHYSPWVAKSQTRPMITFTFTWQVDNSFNSRI